MRSSLKLLEIMSPSSKHVASLRIRLPTLVYRTHRHQRYRYKPRISSLSHSYHVQEHPSRSKSLVPASAVVAATESKRLSQFVPTSAEVFTRSIGDRMEWSSLTFPYNAWCDAPLSAHTVAKQVVQLAIPTYVAYVLELEYVENDVESWEGEG